MPYVAHCPETATTGSTVDPGGNFYAHCSEPLVNVLVNAPFDSASIDPATASAAFGAGFVALGIGILMARAIRLIVHFVRDI